MLKNVNKIIIKLKKGALQNLKLAIQFLFRSVCQRLAMSLQDESKDRICNREAHLNDII